MIKYVISRYETRIGCVEIERETEKTVWVVQGHSTRRRKKDGWELYFDTWEQAHSALLRRRESHVADLRAALTRAEDVLGDIRGMTPPTE